MSPDHSNMHITMRRTRVFFQFSVKMQLPLWLYGTKKKIFHQGILYVEDTTCTKISRVRNTEVDQVCLCIPVIFGKRDKFFSSLVNHGSFTWNSESKPYLYICSLSGPDNKVYQYSIKRFFIFFIFQFSLLMIRPSFTNRIRL